MVGGQLDQLAGEGVQLRRGGDQPGLELDLARIAASASRPSRWDR
jgi:hypothetical protein